MAAPDVTREAWRAEQRRRRAEPTALIERLFELAAVLEKADLAIDDFFGDELRLMPTDKAEQFEAIFPDKPPYFDIAPIARAIKSMADEWQEIIDEDGI